MAFVLGPNGWRNLDTQIRIIGVLGSQRNNIPTTTTMSLELLEMEI